MSHPIPSLHDNDIRPLGDVQTRGCVTTCRVETSHADAPAIAEWIIKSELPDELVRQLQADWKASAAQPAPGGLRQIFLDDRDDCLLRIIEAPLGRPLLEIVESEPLTTQQALAVAISLTRVLAERQRIGRGFERLDGDGIFIDDSGQVQLRDAAIFHFENQDAFLGLPVHELALMPPESSGLLNRPVGPAADNYSVGAVLSTLLASRLPIEAATTAEFFDQQLRFERPSLRQMGIPVSQAIDDLVARLLRREPSDRYQTASGLLHDLETLSDVKFTKGSPVIPIGSRDVRQTLTECNLIGHQAELAILDQALSDAQRGHASWVTLVESESGCRHAVMNEFALQIRSTGMPCFRGTAINHSSPRPLESLDGISSEITTLFDVQPQLAERIAASTSQHAETLGEWLPKQKHLWNRAEASDTPDASAGPEAFAAQRIANAIADLLLQIAKQTGGAALLFDDVDRCDPLTQTILQTIDAAARKLDDSIGWLRVVSRKANDNAASTDETIVELQPLSMIALRGRIQSAAGVIPDKACDAIAEFSEGNATRAMGILFRLVESRVLVPSETGWQCEGDLLAAIRKDESFTETLDRQLATMPEALRRTLTHAAVLGQVFDLQLLSDVDQTPYADALERITQAVTMRLLWRQPQSGSFSFANKKIRERFLSQLDETGQRKVHGAALRALHQDPDASVFDLAYHSDGAGKGEDAFRYAMMAARQARQRYALAIALDHLTIASRWVDPSDLSSQWEIQYHIGEAHSLAGRYDVAEQTFRDAIDLASTRVDRARLHCQIGDLAFKTGRMEDSVLDFERGLKEAGISARHSTATMMTDIVYQSARQAVHTWLPNLAFGLNPRRRRSPDEIESLRLELLSRLSRSYWFTRNKLWTIGNHLRSLNAAETFAPSSILATIYTEHGPACSLVRQFARGHRYIERSLEINQQRNDAWGIAHAYHYQAILLLTECRFEDCIEIAEQAVTIFRQTGDQWELNIADYQKAASLLRLGRYTEAAETAREIYHLGIKIGDHQASGISLDVWARTEPETLPLEIAAEEDKKLCHDAQSTAQTKLGYAIVLMHHRRIDEAIATLQEAIRVCRRVGHLNVYISPCYAWLATALRTKWETVNRRDGLTAAHMLNQAWKAARQAKQVAKNYPADMPHALREIAFLFAIQGNPKRAARYFTRSIRLAASLRQTRDEYQSLIGLEALQKQHANLIGEFPSAFATRLLTIAPNIIAESDKHARTDGNDDSLPSSLSLADRFETVLRSGRKIAQSLQPERVYAEASESARRLLRGQSAYVVSVQGSGEDAKLDAWQGPDVDPLSIEKLHEYKTIIRHAICEKRPIIAGDEPQAEAHAELLTLSPLRHRSLLAAPIMFRGDPVAAIVVEHRELKNMFGNDERKLAEFITALAGAALENADGFKQLQTINDTLEQRVQERTQAAEDRALQLSQSNEQLRCTEEQLLNAIEMANAASEAKSRFLATMSHEIRTPLNGILGMNRLARQVSDDEEQRGYLDTVQQSGRSLLNLINDLLDVSKIEADKMQLERIAVDVRNLANEVIQLMHASAWQKGVDLNLTVSPKVPAYILGDPSRLRQILMNLVGNALKFTAEGSVQVILEANQSDASELSIHVIDSGIGIPESQRDKIFESFSQADSSTTRQYGGSGLGLAICRELTEHMGGKISVDSVVGQGSTFRVVLPMEQCDAPENDSDIASSTVEKNDTDSPSPQPFTSTHVLVAEDGETNQQIIRAYLEMEGIQVTMACNGNEAVELALSKPFDLCLMDVDMPVLDGIKATEKIRAAESSRDATPLPIIAMTAHSDPEILGQCESAGMNDFCPKPIEPESLYQAIQKHMAHVAGPT